MKFHQIENLVKFYPLTSLPSPHVRQKWREQEKINALEESYRVPVLDLTTYVVIFQNGRVPRTSIQIEQYNHFKISCWKHRWHLEEYI